MLQKPNLRICILLLLILFLLPKQLRSDDGVGFSFSYSSGISGLTSSTDIMMNMEMAGGSWSSLLKDPTTITVSVELDSDATDIDLGASPTVFAGALVSYEAHSYTDIATSLAGDAKSANDIDSLSLLQSGTYIEALSNDTSFTPSPVTPSPVVRLGTLAGVEETWNSVLKVSRANSKALGLEITDDGVADIRVIINDEALPLFDFDRSDGIATGMFDFQAIALHEIGHGMGFVSGVDDIDFAGTDGTDEAPGHPMDFSDEPIFTTLDLFRTNVDTRADSIEFGQPTDGGFVLDWRMGPPDGPFSKPFLSLEDVGVDPIEKVPFATGAFNGDGDQASHWASSVDGLFVASLDPGTILDIGDIDVGALDIIGWDTVSAIPEPGSSLVILLLALAGLNRRRAS